MRICKSRKTCKNETNINKILKKEYFFKNYDKIQQALKIVQPIKHKCIEKNMKDFDNDSDLNDKNKVVEDLDFLLGQYNKNERKNMDNYKGMRSANNMFLSSYHLLRSKSSHRQTKKHQFDHLINKYNFPSNVAQRNIFRPTPLAMTKFDDLKIYYRVRTNKRNKNNTNRNSKTYDKRKIKESKIKCASYLENIAEYLEYIKNIKENKRQTYLAAYLDNYSKALINDELRKKTNERNQCQREINQSKKDILDIKETIITLEKKQFNNDMTDIMNSTKISGFGINSRGRSRFSPDTTVGSFFDKKKTEALLLTGRKSEMPLKQLQNFSRQNSTIRQRNSISNNCLTKRAFTVSKTLLDVSKLKVNEMYNRTKNSSLFNNSEIAKDLVKYFKKNKHLNVEKKRLKSCQLVNLISSTKKLVQSVDVRKIINASYSTNNREDIKRNFLCVEKIDQTINKIDYDMFKCALSEKEN